MPEKILYFMDHYPTLGGAANTLLRQAVLMKEAGKDVDVAVSTWRNVCEEYLDICEKEDIPVHRCRFTVASQPEGIDILSVLENYEEIRDFIKVQAPDIVHSVQLNLAVELACRELKIPHIMNIYQALPEFFRFEYEDIFPQYHICDSQCYADFWSRYAGTKSYCVRTVASKGNKRPFSPDKLVFACVGMLCERKNQLEVIKGVEIALRQYGLKGKLKLFGHGEPFYQEVCKTYILDRGLQDSISVEGFCKDMEDIYSKIDVLICGSISESYPNVISEAMAHGVVVISTPVAGVPEVIRDRESGYLCKGYGAEDIAEGIGKFCEDVRTGAIYRILDNIDEVYLQIHAPDIVTERLLECYKEILTRYKGGKHYTIKELENEFNFFINRFYSCRDTLTNADYVSVNLWKIYYVIKYLRELEGKHDCYIWGAGKIGKMYQEILNVFAPDFKIDGFVDSYVKGTYLGCKVVPPAMVLKDDTNVILVGIITQRQEVFRILENYNFQYNSSYFIFESSVW